MLGVAAIHFADRALDTPAPWKPNPIHEVDTEEWQNEQNAKLIEMVKDRPAFKTSDSDSSSRSDEDVEEVEKLCGSGSTRFEGTESQ